MLQQGSDSSGVASHDLVAEVEALSGILRSLLDGLSALGAFTLGGSEVAGKVRLNEA